MGLAEDIIKSGKYPPVIFLFGKEEFLIEEAAEKLLAKLVPDEAAKFNFDSFDCSDKSVNTDIIAGACNAGPMMGDRRVVSIKNFDEIFSLSKGKKAELEKDSLVKYLEDPSPSTVLLIRCGFLSSLKGIAAKLRKSEASTKKKIAGLKLPFNILLGRHAWQEFPEVYDSQIPSLIVSRFRASGYTVDLAGANLLAALVDTDLRVIAGTVERIITHNPEKKNISAEDINYLIGQSRHFNVFELEKAIGKKDITNALNILNNMLKSSGEEIMIIARLTTYFSTLWKLAEEVRKGASGPALAGKIGVHPMFVGQYVAAGKLYSPAEISNAFLRLTNADICLKTTQTDRFFLMQDMLVKIMEGK